MIAIDITGPYPRSGRGRRFILVVTGLFTRWVEAFVINSSDHPHIKRRGLQSLGLSTSDIKRQRAVVHEPSLEKGLPRVADNALDHRDISSSSQSHGTQKSGDKKGLQLHLRGREHKNWDQFLPQILFKFRSRKIAATGVRPAFAATGRNLPRPGD